MSIIQSVPRYGRNAAALLGCVTNETDSDQEILSCLREKPASLLNMLDLPMEIMTQPVVDGDFSLSSEPFLPRASQFSIFCTNYELI